MFLLINVPLGSPKSHHHGPAPLRSPEQVVIRAPPIADDSGLAGRLHLKASTDRMLPLAPSCARKMQQSARLHEHVDVLARVGMG